jgi:2-keto-4-pentenoate hydratase/2-oxohepta-3-ene-1,7-dioic acid hydratase in catechol pathway
MSMQFQRIGPRGSEIPVVIIDGIAYDLRPITADINPSFLAGDPLARVKRDLPMLPRVENANTMRIGTPVANAGAIYCVGMNYAKHALEGGALPPEHIIVFLKPPHTLAGPDDDFSMETGMMKVDWEVELAVVVGKKAWQLGDDDDPMDHIFGFTIANDLSDRYWQLEVSGGQWSKGKSGPGFLPLGPSIVPREFHDPSNVRLQSWVNDEARQDSYTSDMIFSVSRVIRDLSQFTVLEPGDIILTGTPEGVALSGRFPYLATGDVVSLSIEGLGSQKHRIVTGS